MNISRIFHSGITRYFWLMLVFLPLLFINVRSDHDWGGDFAQYINQARCICEGKSQTETGYIFNEQNSYLGPPVYPVGFPLLLAPVYLFFGNNIFAFLILISICLFLLSIVLVKLNELYFNKVLAIVLAAAFVYNPWLLTFKASVLSDIPFTLLFVLSIFFYRKYFLWDKVHILKSLLLGLLLCFSILFKSIGIAVLLGIFLDKLVLMLKNKTYSFRVFLDPVIVSISMLFFYLLFNYILFPSDTEHYSFFLTLFDFSGLFKIVGENYEIYLIFLKDFFSENVVISSLTLSLFLIGFTKKILRNPDIVDYAFIPYILAILFFPAYQGFRYLLPVFPLILIYIFLGLKSIDLQLRPRNKYILPVVVSILLVLFYYQGIDKVFKSKSYIKAGPQTDYSREVFSYIQSNTKADAVFAFTKPRVLALYTSRQSIGIGMVNHLEDLDLKFSEAGVDYVVNTDDLHNQVLDNYIASYSSKLKLVWENNRFKVYKLLSTK